MLRSWISLTLSKSNRFFIVTILPSRMHFVNLNHNKRIASQTYFNFESAILPKLNFLSFLFFIIFFSFRSFFTNFSCAISYERKQKKRKIENNFDCRWTFSVFLGSFLFLLYCRMQHPPLLYYEETFFHKMKPAARWLPVWARMGKKCGIIRFIVWNRVTIAATMWHYIKTS